MVYQTHANAKRKAYDDQMWIVYYTITHVDDTNGIVQLPGRSDASFGYEKNSCDDQRNDIHNGRSNAGFGHGKLLRNMQIYSR
jgi:hypothetical protein